MTEHFEPCSAMRCIHCGEIVGCEETDDHLDVCEYLPEEEDD